MFGLFYHESNYFSSSDSDSDFEENLPRHKRQKNEKYFEYVVPQYSDSVFLEHFRVRRHVAEDIAAKYESSTYYNHCAGRYGKIVALQQVLIFLWFAGHQTASFRDVADRFNIAISTLCVIVQKLTHCISGFAVDVIKWPSTEEKVEIAYFRGKGLAGVVGAIDGSHIKIDRPQHDPESYLNRKKFYSIQLQVVSDHNRRIRDIFAWYPGSVHDARVFGTSPLCGSLEEKCRELFLIGDSAYPCRRQLLTPFRDNGHLSRRQNNFNMVLSRNRCVVEHCFGILKQRFRQLFHIKLRNIKDIVHFIQACCVLHNLTVEDNLEFEEIQDGGDDADDSDDDDNDDDPAGNGEFYLDNVDDRTGVARRNMIAGQLRM